MKHGDEMKGRILHIEEREHGIEYIRFEIEGVVINVPGHTIARYEDEAEPTDTPTVTPTFTFTPTRTLPPPPPTNTPKPYRRPTPLPPRRDTIERGERRRPMTAEDLPADVEKDIENKMRQVGMVSGVLLVISTICYLIAWIMCLADGFRKSGGTGFLLLVFGSPCCCLAIPVVLFYSIIGYAGEKRNGAVSFIVASFVIYILMWVINFSVIWSIISTLIETAGAVQ